MFSIPPPPTLARPCRLNTYNFSLRETPACSAIQSSGDLVTSCPQDFSLSTSSVWRRMVGWCSIYQLERRESNFLLDHSTKLQPDNLITQFLPRQKELFCEYLHLHLYCKRLFSKVNNLRVLNGMLSLRFIHKNTDSIEFFVQGFNGLPFLENSMIFFKAEC